MGPDRKRARSRCGWSGPTHPDRRAAWSWRVLKLTPGQRLALAKELAEVFQRHARAEPQPNAEPYLVHAAFAPKRA